MEQKLENALKAESRIQQEIVQFYRNNFCLEHHTPRHAIFSVPNEGKNAIEQMRKKSTGLMAGVSDLIVVQPDRVLFVECKDDKGIQRPDQITFEQTVKAMGYQYHVVRSLAEFQAII
jgi:hypothetical protein